MTHETRHGYLHGFPEHPYSIGENYNDWWAFTIADNGAFGWVSEAYFAGEGDYKEDGELRYCPRGIAPV